MSSAWLPIRTVNLMGAPPDSWLATISIGRSPAYFSFNNRLGYNIAIPWECQLKTVKKLTFIILLLHVPHAAVKLMIQTVDDACNDLFFRHHGPSSLIPSHYTYPHPKKVPK